MKVSGFQVAHAEPEDHLLDHPYVIDFGVIGVPDEFSGEVPMAFAARFELVEICPQRSQGLKGPFKV